MAAASAAAAPKAAARGSKGPRVNAFDLPELMPGASPSANPAQKEEFQQRCRQLHRDEESDQHERAETATAMRTAAGSGATSADLEAMFPMLDASLVRSLLAEAPNTQHAIDTLLALSAAVSEPVAGGQARPPSPPPRNVGVEDHHEFPSLMDSGGWQVVNAKQLDEQELGSVWRDRAKAAADIPAPRPATSAAPQASAGRRKQSRQKDEEQPEQQQFQTDYEFRQSAGQRRAQHKVKYGRGGAAAAKGLRAPRSSEGDSSEEEEPEESAGLAD